MEKGKSNLTIENKFSGHFLRARLKPATNRMWTADRKLFRSRVKYGLKNDRKENGPTAHPHCVKSLKLDLKHIHSGPLHGKLQPVLIAFWEWVDLKLQR